MLFWNTKILPTLLMKYPFKQCEIWTLFPTSLLIFITLKILDNWESPCLKNIKYYAIFKKLTNKASSQERIAKKLDEMGQGEVLSILEGEDF